MKKIFVLFTVLFSVCASAAIKSGEAAPDFTLPGADGKTYKLSQFKGKVVVLEWFNPDCPYVRKFYDAKAMQAFQKEATDKGTVWLTVASNTEGHEGYLDKKTAQEVWADKGLSGTALLLDSKAEVAKKYGAKTTPHMFIVDKSGKIAYQGAIDDRPSSQAKSLAGAQNYVTTALANLENGEPIKNDSTAPYGCSVKY